MDENVINARESKINEEVSQSIQIVAQSYFSELIQLPRLENADLLKRLCIRFAGVAEFDKLECKDKMINDQCPACQLPASLKSADFINGSILCETGHAFQLCMFSMQIISELDSRTCSGCKRISTKKPISELPEIVEMTSRCLHCFSIFEQV